MEAMYYLTWQMDETDTPKAFFLEMGSGGGIEVDPRADGGIALGCLQIDVIQGDLAGQILGDSQIRHENPGPLLGAAADVGDLDVLLHENTSCQHGNFSENDGLFGFIIVRLPWCFNEKNRFESGKYGYDPGGLRIVWRMLDFLMDEEPITVQKRNGGKRIQTEIRVRPRRMEPGFPCKEKGGSKP